MAKDPNFTANELAKWLITLRSEKLICNKDGYDPLLKWNSDPVPNESVRDISQNLNTQDQKLLRKISSDNSFKLSSDLSNKKETRRNFLTKAFYSGIVGFCVLQMGDEFYPLGNVTADLSTATGQRRFYRLKDGSRLLLDARSGANINFCDTARRVRLLSGALSVQVADDNVRPFFVYTKQGTIYTKNKASFMVRQQAQRTLVAVHDDSIQIETMTGETKNIISGQGVRFDSQKIGTPRSEIIAEASWENGNIDAHGRPLVDIIESLRPYRVAPLRISAAAGGLPVFGHYSLDDTDATLNALQHCMPISIHYYGLLGISINITSSGSIRSKITVKPNSIWKDFLGRAYSDS